MGEAPTYDLVGQVGQFDEFFYGVWASFEGFEDGLGADVSRVEFGVEVVGLVVGFAAA